MKNIWNKLRNKWLDYWEDDEFNMIKWHLSSMINALCFMVDLSSASLH